VQKAIETKRISTQPDGRIDFPKYGEEYFKQITAEQLVTKLVKGYRRHEWQKMRERNEALDCRVYARAAAARVGIDRFQDKHWADWERRVAPPAKDEKQQQQRTGVGQTSRNRVRFRMEV
jgi:phage terminase large subunit GpA-like protein